MQDTLHITTRATQFYRSVSNWMDCFGVYARRQRFKISSRLKKLILRAFAIRNCRQRKYLLRRLLRRAVVITHRSHLQASNNIHPSRENSTSTVEASDDSDEDSDCTLEGDVVEPTSKYFC